MPLHELPEFGSDGHKTMTYSRTVGCHYSFMHENLLDMNHQFLHRGVVGRIHPELLDHETGPRLGARRGISSPTTAGKKSACAALLKNERRRAGLRDVITIRTGYPYQTLSLVRPVRWGCWEFALWAAYVPAVCRAAHQPYVSGLLMIAKPPTGGALNLAWPLIRRFTERVFAEDRMAVEAEQRAWDEQGRDCNREVFPLILDVRDVLRSEPGAYYGGAARLRGALLEGRAAGRVCQVRVWVDPCWPKRAFGTLRGGEGGGGTWGDAGGKRDGELAVPAELLDPVHVHGVAQRGAARRRKGSGTAGPSPLAARAAGRAT